MTSSYGTSGAVLTRPERVSTDDLLTATAACACGQGLDVCGSHCSRCGCTLH